ncbi:MAG TPA: ABC transporter permease [Kofleriaceae bacterium]|nr:ABC transporter permease [Kofleriaceae bacterium]
MFGYYIDLALHSFRRNVSLTTLMIVAIAFGVGASMTTLTVLHVLSADPIPGHSHELHYVQLDHRKARDVKPGEEPPRQVTRYDAETLVRAAKADRQAMMTGGNAAIEPQRPGLTPFFADGRWTSADFFAMFRVPFIAGSGWTAEDDTRNARVAVITRALADKLFGAIEVVGRSVRVEGTELRVIGVIENWRPAPHFYDLNNGDYTKGEQLFIPFSTSRELKLSRSGNMNCWGESPDPEAVGAPCEWIQYWVELGDSSKAAAYRDYLIRYSQEQKTAGRFEVEPNVHLRDVMEWLDFNQVVPKDARLQTWIALGFLLVCLINTVGLLLTKFLRRSAEIGVRRALGASKRSIFIQLVVESGAIGLVGGTLGLGLAWLGLWAVRHQPTSYAELARLDLPMLAATFALALFSSLLAGLLPAWRGCQVTPAIQLKSH